MTIKKNQKGMTLVEVVIALGVFSFTFLGVTICLSAALKLTNRNMMRDHELNVQQEVIEQHQIFGVSLRPTSGGVSHPVGGDKIVFGSPDPSGVNLVTGKGTVNGVTQYQAIKTADNGTTYSGNTYNFEIKSFSSTPLGGVATEFDRANSKYGISVINMTEDNLNVSIELKHGQIYEGDYANGYKSSSPIFSRTIPGKSAGAAGTPAAGIPLLPSQLKVGYYNDSPVNTPDLFDGSTITIYLTSNGVSRTVNVAPMNFVSMGGIEVTLNADGSVSKAYKDPTT